MSHNQRLFKFLDVVSFILILLNIVSVPLFLDKNLANFYVMPKQYLFIGLILVSILFLAVRTVLLKKFEYRRSIIDLPIIFILAIALLSGIFSATPYDSFLGRNDYFVFNFSFLLFLAGFYFFLVNVLHSETRWRAALDTVVAVGGLTAIIFITKAIFRLDVLSAWLPSAWNTVDSLNSTFGLWLVVVLLLSAGQIIKKDLSAGRLLVCFFVSILTMVSLVLLSFKMLWWILLIGLLLLLLLGVSFIKEARLGWLSVLFAVLIAVAVFIVFGSPRALQSSMIPAEISLGIKPSWAIASNTVLSGVKNFFLGSGLGSFVVDFSQFRTAEFNNDPAAWSLRFSQPFSSMLAVASEGGVLLFLAFIFLVLFVLGHVLLSWFRARPENGVQAILENISGSAGVKLEVFLVALAWVLVSIGSAVFFYGPTLWWIWWLLLGLTVVGISFFEENIIKTKKLTIEDTPQYNLSFSFIVIVIMAAITMLGVWGARLYLAEDAYAKALRSSSYDAAESNLVEALASRSTADVYHVALAQVYLAKAVEAGRQAKPDIQAISSLMAQAVNEAKRATDLSPRSAAIWANLATMYENAAVLVAEARDWAIKSLSAAKELEPTNPVLYWRLGNNYGLGGKWDDAAKQYQQAIALKKDYAGAYLGLANAFEQLKQYDKAINVYQTISAGSNNAEVLFNYGRLLYNRNQSDDRANAEKLWLMATQLMPNYSNALYSLGLLYESRGDKSSALQYYYKVKDLNPDNKDIVAKIRALVGAEPAQP